jgi:hypothetical protein
MGTPPHGLGSNSNPREGNHMDWSNPTQQYPQPPRIKIWIGPGRISPFQIPTQSKHKIDYWRVGHAPFGTYFGREAWLGLVWIRLPWLRVWFGLVLVVVVVVLLVVVVVRRRQRWQRQSVVPPINKYESELNYGRVEGEGEGGADIAAWLGLTKSMEVCRTEQHTRASTKNLPS